MTTMTVWNQSSVGNSLKSQSGYDIPVYGLDNGYFYYIHIPALICIVASFICAVVAIVLSFKAQNYRNFFKTWSKSERFIVYLAICDGMFNISHFTDHMHILILKDMVYPRQLCEFYGFNLALFVTAQNLMVNCVAVNAFMLIYFDKNLKFGRKDWRLLLWTFGAPLAGGIIAGAAGKLGPNGVFCYFDIVKGKIANICFTTVPLLTILALNIILYILTWKRIREQTKKVMSKKVQASHRSAKAMSLFVAAFFIQWWAMALFGIWSLAGDVPQAVFHLVVTFSNVGGILNLCVYKIMHYKGFAKTEQSGDPRDATQIRADVKEAESTVTVI